MIDHIRIATRESQLALWQAEYVKARLEALYPDVTISLVGMTTRGDQILDKPLSKIGGKGLFIKELEQAILENRADLAVHSMKDVPMELPPGFCLAAICERENPTDALVSNQFTRVDQIPANARIGTSSLRRRYQIRDELPRAEYLDLRGNVNTRLAKLDAGNYDAIILASAGLIRLQLEERISQELDINLSTPAAGQGAVGIECRNDQPDLIEMLSALNHEQTAQCVKAERSFAGRLEASCTLPLAAYCTYEDAGYQLRTYLADAAGSRHMRLDASGDEPVTLGINLAEELLRQGGDELLGTH